MKKTIKWLSVVLMVVLGLSLFAACGEDSGSRGKKGFKKIIYTRSKNACSQGHFCDAAKG